MSENAESISVVIVDDHDMVRRGLKALLDSIDELHLVGHASNGVEAVKLCGELQPDVVLMDLVMPKGDGVSAIAELHKQFPSIRIIALSNFQDEELVQNALEAGAISYVLKNVTIDELVKTIRDAYYGKATLAPEVAQILIGKMSNTNDDDKPALSEREREVLQYVAIGLNNKEIAQKLNLSTSTIKNHLSNILESLGASNRAEAVHIGMVNKLIK